KNPLFARAWVNATATWQSWGPLESPLSPAQAIAVIAYVMDDRLQSTFNDAVRVAGRSPQEYRDNFHFKTLHFLLTDALATVRDTQEWTCTKLVHWDCEVRFEAKRGDTIRFGHFVPIRSSETSLRCPVKTEFQVHACHGSFSRKLEGLDVLLIPPFETFQVTQVTHQGDKTQIKLLSNNSFSKYNCEWLKGDSTGDSL
ncbi:NARE ribosyltransferase, partial [Pycnonotus jocosus]|nr:NARE ribosyltransferase [Pycnonotus jocosus]